MKTHVFFYDPSRSREHHLAGGFFGAGEWWQQVVAFADECVGCDGGLAEDAAEGDGAFDGVGQLKAAGEGAGGRHEGERLPLGQVC